MTSLHDIPEIARSRGARGRVRIPPGVDVPLTPRVRRLIDSPSFRRLSQISQVGLVRLIYPVAVHTRQEHSLGVFLAAIEYLDQLAANERFAEIVSPNDAELLLAASLLHDIGHWPFGHPIEDLDLPEISEHESLAAREITTGPIADTLRADWNLNPQDVANLVCGNVQSRAASTAAQHSLGADRRRQNRLPDARQPARGRPLRSAFRPTTASSAACASTNGRRRSPSPIKAKRPPK